MAKANTDLIDEDIEIADVEVGENEYLYVFTFVGVVAVSGCVIKCYPKYLLNAKEEKRTAYTIISNKGLVSLATYRLTTKEEFVSLYGLGETIYQSFGIKFITAIKDFYNQS